MADHSRGLPSEGTDYQSLPNAVIALLPTPAVNDMGAAYTPETWDEWTATMKAKHNNGNGHGKSLNVEAQRLLPTPTRRDFKDTEIRREPHRPDDIDTLARALTDVLLPTPRATDGTKGGPNQRGSSGDLMLPSAVNLLPTPTAMDSAQSGGSTASDIILTDAIVRTDLGRQENHRHAVSAQAGPGEELRSVRDTVVQEALQERAPRGQDGVPQAEALFPELREQPTGGPSEHSSLASPADQATDRVRGMRDDGRRAPCSPRRPGCDEQRAGEPERPVRLVSPEAALAGGSRRSHGVDFGAYEAAIQRWEAVLGREAPAPTKLSPAGWITDVPGITWNEVLKACGNGVVPRQAAAAIRFLWVMADWQVAA